MIVSCKPPRAKNTCEPTTLTEPGLPHHKPQSIMGKADTEKETLGWVGYCKMLPLIFDDQFDL